MLTKYNGNFAERRDVAVEFGECSDRYGSNPRVVEGFPTDEEIIYAEYETPSYEGYAFVLYERAGTLYEVSGSHCSCFGLEGQWRPEETSWAALAIREPSPYGCPSTVVDEAKQRSEQPPAVDAVDPQTGSTPV